MHPMICFETAQLSIIDDQCRICTKGWSGRTVARVNTRTHEGPMTHPEGNLRLYTNSTARTMSTFTPRPKLIYIWKCGSLAHRIVEAGYSRTLKLPQTKDKVWQFLLLILCQLVFIVWYKMQETISFSFRTSKFISNVLSWTFLFFTVPLLILL